MGKITTDEDIAFSLRADEFIFGLLTHGKDDRVGGEFHRRGAIHRFERYRFDAVATIDLDRLERRNHGNAQAHRIVELFLRGGHRFHRLDKRNVNRIGADLLRRRGAIHRDVATTDDHDATQFVDLAAILARILEERQRRRATLEIRSRQIRNHLRRAQSNPDKNGIVLRRHPRQIFLLDALIHLEFHAKRLHGIDILVDHFIAQTRRRNAIAQQTACFLVLVDDRHIATHLRKLCRHRQTRRTRANAKHLLTIRCRRLERLHLKDLLLIHRKRLQTANLNRAIYPTTATRLLAKTLPRAYLGTTGTQNVVVADRTRRTLEILKTYRTYEFPRIRPRRAVVRTRGIVTQQATRRFFHHQTDIPSIFCQFTIGELSYFCHDPSPNHVVNEKPPIGGGNPIPFTTTIYALKAKKSHSDI